MGPMLTTIYRTVRSIGNKPDIRGTFDEQADTDKGCRFCNKKSHVWGPIRAPHIILALLVILVLVPFHIERQAAKPCTAVPCAPVPCAAVPCAPVPCAAVACAPVPCAAVACAPVPCAAVPCAASPPAPDLHPPPELHGAPRLTEFASPYDVEVDPATFGGAARDVLLLHNDRKVTPLFGSGNPKFVLFSGRCTKVHNGPILSCGPGLVFDNPIEYRLINGTFSIDYSGLRKGTESTAGEAVETDLCLNIYDKNQPSTLESGEEIFCVHEHFMSDYPKPQLPCSMTFPKGGIPIVQGQKLVASSVSQVFPDTADMASRTADPHPEKPFLGLYFQVYLQRADTMDDGGKKKLASFRSPRRDRSFAITPSLDAPSTSYVNVGDQPIEIVGMAMFLSALSHYVLSYQELVVSINSVEKFRYMLPPHIPGVSDDSSTGEIMCKHFILAPGDVILARISVIAEAAVVYDSAVFFFANASSNTLIPHSEQVLLPAHDLNADGADDRIDYDSLGLYWAEQSKVTEACRGSSNPMCKPAHDQQYSWSDPLLIPMKSFQDNIQYLKNDSKHRYLLASSNDPEWSYCFEFSRPQMLDPPQLTCSPDGAKYTMKYCNETAVPHGGYGCAVHFHRGVEKIYLDLNSDGYIDRIRQQHRPGQWPSLMLAFGGPTGLAPEIVWVNLGFSVCKWLPAWVPRIARYELYVEACLYDGFSAPPSVQLAYIDPRDNDIFPKRRLWWKRYRSLERTQTLPVLWAPLDIDTWGPFNVKLPPQSSRL